MRLMNFPSASRPVLRTRGRLSCNVTVSVDVARGGGGVWATPPCGGTREASAMASRQRKRTLEPVIEPEGETQPFAGSDRLGYVHAESAPIQTQSRIDEPVVELRNPVPWHAIGSVADEPRLARVGKHDNVESLEPEEGRGRSFVAILVFVFPGVVAPVELHVPAILGLKRQHAVARGDARIGKRGIGERGIARARAER